MLDEDFLANLREEFPRFYQRANEEAMREASRLRAESGGDLERALARAKLQGAAQLWWPYVKGSVPLVGDDREAMECFTRLVLTVDHVVGYQPPTMEAARDQVVHVLREAVDYDRLKRLMPGDREEQERKEATAKGAAAGAAAGAGVLASLSAFVSPVTTYRMARRYWRLVPPPLRVTAAGVLVAAMASLPLVAGYTAGLQAERSARNYGESPAAGATSGNGSGARTAPTRAKVA